MTVSNVAYRGTPEKMTTVEYRARTMWPHGPSNAIEYVLHSLYVYDTVSGPRTEWRRNMAAAIGRAGFSLQALKLEDEVPRGFPLTLAVLAMNHLHTQGGTLLVFTPSDIIVFNNGLAYDTAAYRPVTQDTKKSRYTFTVKRHVNSAFRIIKKDRSCECADPLVFGMCTRCPFHSSAVVKNL